MRVALVVESTAYGGAEAYAAQLLRHLPPEVRPTLVATERAPRRLADAATGDGPEREELNRQAHHLRSGGTEVSMPGEVADVATALAEADLFCLPSRDEGLPLALLEATAGGRARATARLVPRARTAVS